MISYSNGIFHLETEHTSYLFQVMETGHLEHLYYGRKLHVAGQAESLREQHAFAPGNTNLYDNDHKNFTLEDIRLEMSSYGKGDIREPFVEIEHADGSTTSDFRYETYEITKGDRAQRESTLPVSYDETGEVMHLAVSLWDRQYDLELVLYYHVYEDCDVITRSALLRNHGKEPVNLLRLMNCTNLGKTTGILKKFVL